MSKPMTDKERAVFEALSRGLRGFPPPARQADSEEDEQPAQD